MQHGAAFAGLTERVWEMSSVVVDVGSLDPESTDRQIHVTGLERYATRQFIEPTLGRLRQTVSELLSRGVEVCLWSSAPRVAFAPVPGSSLIDDASPFFLETLPATNEDPESVYPAVQLGASLSAVYRTSLTELGVAVLASLDRAMYDGQLGPSAIFDVLDAREIEALRGAGIALCCEGDPYALTAPLRFGELREELATTLAEQLEPQSELDEIASDLWTIERTIRLALRSAAVIKFGNKWRGSVLHGDLNGKVLGRAMIDGSVSIKSSKELRDPIEWLSLGELIEIVTSNQFDNLGLAPVVWTKFGQDVIPVRNRLSHMRHFKHGDRSVVRMWVSQIARMLG
ncbi:MULTISPECIES: hypothetical protein [Actinomycetes]|uniref:hypothetical protein n=1 Tax=Actinomycetes TaxID=1760 RepID=UPI001BD69D40|nr:hypothetical protein [Nocardioides aquaticus]